jgi:hypothetical protein
LKFPVVRKDDGQDASHEHESGFDVIPDDPQNPALRKIEGFMRLAGLFIFFDHR